MTAWAFTMAYNEALLIPYWIRHHRTFCDRIIVYVDTETNDGTQTIARDEGAEVRDYPGTGQMDDIAMVAFANTEVVEAVGRADWVIWMDTDELLYHRNMMQRLDELKAAGVNLPTTAQYTMMSDSPPTHVGQIYDMPQFRNGYCETEGGAKVAIFNPNEISLQWGPGKHWASVQGVACRDDDGDPLKVLHYRGLGEEYLLARNARNYSRMPARNIAAGFGYHTYPDYVGPFHPAWLGTRPSEARPVVP